MEYPCEYCGTPCIRLSVRPLCSLKCRLLGNIEIRDDCWIWLGKKSLSWGYGAIMVEGKRRSAHRISYELFVGPIEKEKILCHACNIKSCINPKHLYQGTLAQNARDIAKSGILKGENNASAKLTEEDIFKIRELRKAGLKYKAIATQFGVNFTHIAKILRGEVWKHI